MPKKKLVETVPEEKLVEVEVVTYKEGEEPVEVSTPPSKLVTVEVVNPLLEVVKTAVGSNAVILDVFTRELESLPPVKFVVVLLQKDSHKSLLDTNTLFDASLNQTKHTGAHPEVISLISEALAKVTKDSVVVEYE